MASSPTSKRELLDGSAKGLSIKRQCELLGLARSTAYHRPKDPLGKDQELMNRIDEIYLEFPYFGSRQMVRMLQREGRWVSRKRVQRLMRRMGLQAQGPKPNLSRPTPGHKIFPYLMKGLVIDGPGQAWCADITYIRLKHGFVFLVAILDWYSRKVLAWRLSNSLDATFCVEALEDALRLYGPPSKAMNTDQGGQFTGAAWIGTLQAAGVTISMDGRGRAIDNVFIERFWRSLKHEEVYRRDYTSVPEARRYIAEYIHRYNHRRPHSSHGHRTPAEVHTNLPPAPPIPPSHVSRHLPNPLVA